jgi:hypothetical protein
MIGEIAVLRVLILGTAGSKPSSEKQPCDILLKRDTKLFLLSLGSYKQRVSPTGDKNPASDQVLDVPEYEGSYYDTVDIVQSASER